MSEENNAQSTKKRGNFFVGLLIIVVIIGAGILIPWLISFHINSTASDFDITGDWTDYVSYRTYTFIPRANIKGLELDFTFYDKDLREVGAVHKTIGDVKKGQQYSTTISITEFDFKTLWNGTYLTVEVSAGTRSLF